MREILFRGKRTDNGQWKYGLLTKLCGESCIFSEENEIDVKAVFLETVQQYTGMTDKNGKKIFEGDVVCCTGTWEFPFLGVVQYSGASCAFYVETKEPLNAEWSTYLLGNQITVEVKGNIYDNPELMEDKQ